MIKEFRIILDNTQDTRNHVAINRDTQQFIKHKSHNRTDISDEPLHAMELCICYGSKVQVEGLEGECKSQMCRCTGSQSWCGGDQWNDWV